jgi:hypothetical protein
MEMKATKMKASIVGAFLLIGLVSSSVTPSYEMNAPTLGADGCPIEEPCFEYETEMAISPVGIDTFEGERVQQLDEARAWELLDKYEVTSSDTKEGSALDYIGVAIGSDPQVLQTQFKVREPNNTTQWYVFESVLLTYA